VTLQARGCFARPERIIATPRVQLLPQQWRALLCTTGSFTQALERHTGAPVAVVPLTASREVRPFSTAVLARSVRLESAQLKVFAHSTISGIATPALKNAFLGLSDTPLMRLLQHQAVCQRPLLQIGYRRGLWFRVGHYRIYRARLMVCECVPDSIVRHPMGPSPREASGNGLAKVHTAGLASLGFQGCLDSLGECRWATDIELLAEVVNSGF